MTPPIAPTPQPMPDDSAFLLRWRGKQEGPLKLAELEGLIAANQIGLLHEIQFEGEWIPLRKFLELRAAHAEGERLRREEAERRVREEAERQAREREARQREELLAEEKRKNDLLEAAVRAQQPTDSEGDSKPRRSGLAMLGWLLLLGGAVIALYFFAVFDPSVSSELGRVVNLGRLNDRQAGLLLGLGMSFVGVLLVIFARRKP